MILYTTHYIPVPNSVSIVMVCVIKKVLLYICISAINSAREGHHLGESVGVGELTELPLCLEGLAEQKKSVSLAADLTGLQL